MLNSAIGPFCSFAAKAHTLVTLEFLKGIYERIMRSDEIGAILRALEGRFIEPGPGEDFLRMPEVYPTGRNTYQLDPTNLPTETAMERVKCMESKGLIDSLLSNVELVAQVRDTVDYEITDLDHYYEFLGGLTKAVESRSGQRPMVLVADTIREAIKVEDVREAVKRGIV